MAADEIDNVIHHPPAPIPSALRRRAVVGGTAVAGAAALTAGAGAASATERRHGHRRHHGQRGHRGSGRRPFVTARNGEFRAAGERFRFGGTNCYDLHRKPHDLIDAMLDDAAATGLPVVRAHAFADGPSDGALQPEPYVYDDEAFDALDYAVSRAGRLGLRLVLPLTDNWPHSGGMQQYVKWFLGLSGDSHGAGTHHDRFYTTESIKDCYKAYVRHVTRRRNPYTGLRYRHDPTIMAFELANEPRCRSDRSGETLLSWVREMSAHLKKQAPRQLVAVGDEGFYGEPGHEDYPYSDFEGVPWKRLVAVPTVDYATFRLHPHSWGETEAGRPGTDLTAWGVQWIEDHIADGRRLGKPVVLEEYGVGIDAAKDIPDAAARDAAYSAWTGAVEERGGAGSLASAVVPRGR